MTGFQRAARSRAEQPPIVKNVGRAGGQPPAAKVRQPVEARFRQDFSQVRVHIDREAATSASEVGAPDSRVRNRLTEIQGLPMFRLLPALEVLPFAVRSDERAGEVVGGPRLVTAMRVVAARGSAWEPFQARNRGELAALPADQVDDIGAYLRARDVKDLRSTIPAIAAQDIRANWRSRKQDFLVTASDPSNTLNADQMYQIWLHYWTDEQAAARAQFEALEPEAKTDLNVYSEKVTKFQAGRRGVFSPAYEAAADRLAAAEYFSSYLIGVHDWLETYVGDMHRHVTLEQVNHQAAQLVKGRALHLEVLGLALLFEGRPRSPKSEPVFDDEVPATRSEPVTAPKPRLRDASPGDYPRPLPDETPEMYARRTTRDWKELPEPARKIRVDSAKGDMERATLHHTLRDPNGVFTHFLTEGGFEEIMIHGELRAGAGVNQLGGGPGVRAMGGAFRPEAPVKSGQIYLDFTVPDPPVPGNVTRFNFMGDGVMWRLPEGDVLPVDIKRVGYPNGAVAERGGSRGWVLRTPGAEPRDVTLQQLLHLGRDPR